MQHAEVQTISGPIVFEQYIVVADYEKQSKNDINLKAGDIVDVIEKNEYGKFTVFYTFVPRKGEKVSCHF